MERVLKLKLQKDSDLPVYKQIAQKITELVQSGELGVGDKLPTERELAERLDVSRGTVSKAYETLTQNFIIEVVQGSGCFISQRQDVVTGERKERAVRILEKAIDELLDLRFSSQELGTFFHLLLSRRDEEAEIKVLAIDCNSESLELFEKQLYYIKNLKIKKMLLSDLPSKKTGLKEYDLILTTSTHYRELCGAIPEYKAKMLACPLSLAQQTIIDLSQISPQAKIAVFCETSRFYDIVVGHLRELQIATEDILFIRGESSAEDLKEILADRNILITKNQGISTHSLGQFAQFVSRGGQLISFNYQIDRGTLHLVEDRIDEIIRKNISSFEGRNS